MISNIIIKEQIFNKLIHKLLPYPSTILNKISKYTRNKHYKILIKIYS